MTKISGGRTAAARLRLMAAMIAALLKTSSALAEAPTVALWSPTNRPIDRLAAGPNRLFALAGGELLTFDGDGNPRARCAGFAAPPGRQKRPPLLAPDADDVLRAAGLPDDDDSTTEAEDALESEGLGPAHRRRATPDEGIVPRALAPAPGDGVWIATSNGVFRGDDTGCVPAGLEGRDLLLVTADGESAVAATEDLLFRRDAAPDGAQPEAPDGDPDPVFTVAAGLPVRPRALALGADGAALVGTDDGLLAIGRDGAVARILDRAADAVAVCGGVALVLASDGVYRFIPGVDPMRVADRPPARTLACGLTADARWIATGLGVWTSTDGAAWTERPETMGRAVAGAAAIGERIWLAVESGLLAIDAWPSEGVVRPLTLPRESAGFGPLPTWRFAAPTVPWPRITAAFDLEQTLDRRLWAVLVLLTFPLDRAGVRRVDPTFVTSELGRRDEALAREQVDLERSGNDDESSARLNAVRQEREALR